MSSSNVIYLFICSNHRANYLVEFQLGSSDDGDNWGKAVSAEEGYTLQSSKSSSSSSSSSSSEEEAAAVAVIATQADGGGGKDKRRRQDKSDQPTTTRFDPTRLTVAPSTNQRISSATIVRNTKATHDLGEMIFQMHQKLEALESEQNFRLSAIEKSTQQSIEELSKVIQKQYKEMTHHGRPSDGRKK